MIWSDKSTYKNIKMFIKEHGIIHWLFIKQQIRRQYPTTLYYFIRSKQHYTEFQKSMILWDNYYSKYANSITF